MSNELVRASDTASWDLISAGGLDGMLKACEALAKSKVLPAHLATGGAVLAVVLRGREMGMGPLEACHSMHNIEGRVVLDATAQLALAKRAGVRCQWQETTDRVATLHLSRSGEDFTSTYTIEMAKRAGLAGRATWAKYPEAMLRARAITAGIRAFCPDVLGAGAVYDRDEVADEPAPSRRPEAIDVEVVPADRREPTDERQKPKPSWRDEPIAEGHDAEFDSGGNKRLGAQLGELGIDMGVLSDWLTSDAGRDLANGAFACRVSSMGPLRRAALVAGLQRNDNVVATIIASTTKPEPDRQPGDEAPDDSTTF